MPETVSISDVRLTRASHVDRQSGLLGWISLVLNESILVDGITLRCTSTGVFILSFPARRDRAGRDHPYLRPLTETTRRAIEMQVFRALGIGEEAA